MNSDLLPFAVAKLLSETPGITQDVLAEKLGTSQSHVSRIVRDLKDNRKLLERWHIDPELRARPEWSRMEDELLGISDVGQSIAGYSPFPESFQLRVVGTFSEAEPAPDEFGKAAAAVIEELIVPVRRLGVGCGKTLEAVIRGMSPVGRESGIPKKRIIPIIAEPAHLRNIDQSPSYSSTHMAESLQETLYGGIQTGVPVLRGVTAYLPRRYRTREVLQMVQGVPGFRSIFLGDAKKNEPAEIDLLDCILTGAGTVSPGDDGRQGTLIRERLEQEKHISRGVKNRLDASHLDEIICGDLTGILIPREGISAKDSALVADLNEGLVGLQAAHLNGVCAAPQEPEIVNALARRRSGGVRQGEGGSDGCEHQGGPRDYARHHQAVRQSTGGGDCRSPVDVAIGIASHAARSSSRRQIEAVAEFVRIPLGDIAAKRRNSHEFRDGLCIRERCAAIRSCRRAPSLPARWVRFP